MAGIGEQRVAPPEQNVGLVALCDMVGLVDAGRDLREREAIRRVLRPGRAALSNAGPNRAVAAATPSAPRSTSRRW